MKYYGTVLTYIALTVIELLAVYCSQHSLIGTKMNHSTWAKKHGTLFVLLSIFVDIAVAEFEIAPTPVKMYDEPTVAAELLEFNTISPKGSKLKSCQDIEFYENIIFVEKSKLAEVVQQRNNGKDIIVKDTNKFSEKVNPDPSALSCNTISSNPDTECQNCIRVVQPIENTNYTIVCGTNGLLPVCYNCTFDDATDNLICDGDDSNSFYFTGDSGLVPHNPLQDLSWYFEDVDGLGNAVFTGGNEESEQDSVISRATVTDGKLDVDTVLKTDSDDPNWLNNAEFVGDPIPYGDHVYYFFRETATEYINAGKIVYSRVGRICKTDEGGDGGSLLDGKWTTFQKARLNCSVQGEIPFYYNKIQDIHQTTEADGEVIFATFSTSPMLGSCNTPTSGDECQKIIGASGSAVCVFRMDEINELFNQGKFKGQASPSTLWLPVADGAVPTSPRPGACGMKQPESKYSFIKNYPLMDELVPNTRNYRVKQSYNHESNSPLASMQGVNLVELVVDEEVKDANGTKHDIFFLASGVGIIYKMYEASTNSPVLIEEYDLNLNETNDELLKNMKLKDGALFIATTDRVVTMPVEHCNSTYDKCYKCVKAQDPYCSWLLKECQSQSIGGKQCLRDHINQTPYECDNNCEDWPSPKVAFVSGDQTYVVQKPMPIHLYFVANAPPYSKPEYNFTCDCDNGSNCTDMFTRISSTADDSGASAKQWIDIAFIADMWDENCNATLTYSVTAKGEVVTRTRRIEIDNSSLDIANYFGEPLTEEAIMDFDEDMAKYQYNVSEWKKNAAKSCFPDDVKICTPDP